MHLTLFCTPHPRESRASGEMIDDARRKAIPRLQYPKYRRDVPTRATRTHSRQPNRRRHARVTPAPADEGHGRAQHDGKEADEQTAASVATARVGDCLERVNDVHCTSYLLSQQGSNQMYQKIRTFKSPKIIATIVDSNRANMLK